MDWEKDEELIDRFLKNELQGDELTQFTNRLAAEAALRDEVELQRRLVMAVKAADLREGFKRAEREHQAREASLAASPGRRRYLAVAATFTLLLAAGLVLYFFLRQPAGPAGPPALETVAYGGEAIPEGAAPPFPTMPTRSSGSTPKRVPVLLYSPVGDYTFHYQFADTLRLYGNFAGARLRFNYRPAEDAYSLTVDSVDYPLTRSKEITALTPATGR